MKDEGYKNISKATHPVQPKQEQGEPVAYLYKMPVEDDHWVWNYCTYLDNKNDPRCEPLYTTPQQRIWVGMTAQGRWEIIYATERDDRTTVMELVEAKLKEKNT
jgi:hypothetical protein